MERINVHGLNVRETDVGESDKIITLVTEEYGRLTVTAKGVRSLRSKNMVACQPFAFANYVLRRSKKYFYVEETELIDCFFNLRADLDKLSLAAYVCDVCCDVSVENQPDPELLRLTLNTLYAISNKDMPLQKIKAAFEFRCSAVCGFCPDLSQCDRCGKETHPKMYLDVMNGRLLCGDCKPFTEREEIMEDNGTARLYYLLSEDVLAAMRYIAEAPAAKFLSFNIDEDGLYLLEKYSEGYLVNHLEHGFGTLDFYKSILL
ncbi:MAG: DNA repair protein RecO [Clostridia bacterium]|nr:DNA repair protein RecO [Clostridia bacterium]